MNEAATRERVLLVGENDDWLDGLSTLLLEGSHVGAVSRAHSAAEALERTHLLTPHVVFVDATLPDESGFALVKRLKSLGAPPTVILMSFHRSRAFEDAATAAGADGCLWKAEPSAGSLQAIGPVLFRMNG